MTRNILTNLAFVGLFLLLALVTSQVEPAHAKRRGGCGRGCLPAMGSCKVESGLWSAILNAKSKGIKATSCCRSEEYNRQLRSCGYKPSTTSQHMFGRAVDILVSPAKCNSGSLAGYGFSGVCPHYHAGHCHVQKCGTSASRSRARSNAGSRARQIRARNIRNSYRGYSISPSGGSWPSIGR